ncbi:MAG TPA: Cys-tRNA(Pro) deacylase [Spirochaetales bacterium]|nr:Cys-tRNA(Pro) deacylase [Spirochaetales bacterium]
MAKAGQERQKTNALRILDGLGIAYRTIAYEVDEEDLSAESVAAKVSLDPERVFKTLALRGASGAVFLACVPAGSELDLKKASKAAGEKSVDMLPLKELQPTTGYVRGGCSPIGAKRKFPVYLDETATLFEEISVSAGQRGLQVLLAPEELRRAASEQPGGQAEAGFADLV